MGNMHCPAEDAAHVASVAPDICPFPNYNPGPHLSNMLSVNSSVHLRNHYMAVQSSLTSKQLEDFTQGLKTTFGREGKVTLGGVGVVALSLAVLFDTLAGQARGEWVSDSRPIPGLFVENMRSDYPPHVYTISKYLRLVPHIANSPTRMREETERYMKQLITDDRSLGNLEENDTLQTREDVTAVNMALGQFFIVNLQLHLQRIKNGTANELITFNENLTIHNTNDPIFNLNCDPEAASREFLAEMQKSDNHTQEAFERCKTNRLEAPKTWLHHIAQLVWLDAMFIPLFSVGDNTADTMIAQREDFDLKANALGKWS